jgi:hypothetical protein
MAAGAGEARRCLQRVDELSDRLPRGDEPVVAEEVLAPASVLLTAAREPLTPEPETRFDILDESRLKVGASSRSAAAS